MCVCVTMCVSMPGARAGVCTWQQEHPPSRKTQPGPALLTCNGQDDNHKIENVPADSEVVMAQGQHLEHTLSCEDDDKDHVDVVQDVHLELALVVRLHHHGDHVEADEDHNADIKDLFGYKIKDHALEFVLDQRICKSSFRKGEKKSNSTHLILTQQYENAAFVNTPCLSRTWKKIWYVGRFDSFQMY